MIETEPYKCDKKAFLLEKWRRSVSLQRRIFIQRFLVVSRKAFAKFSPWGEGEVVGDARLPVVHIISFLLPLFKGSSVVTDNF